MIESENGKPDRNGGGARRSRNASQNDEHDADDIPIELISWPETGAPHEHMGFGRMSNEAKNRQTEFLAEWLRP